MGHLVRGGAVLNSLVAGVPWAAVVTVETWTDLYSALAPQGSSIRARGRARGGDPGP